MERETILLLHSISGILIFISGLLQIIMKKGGATHRFIGNSYLYLWLFLLITGAYLGGLLITLIGVFGFYFTLTGARIGNLKNKSIQLFDKAIFSLGLLISLAILYYGVELYIKGSSSFATIFVVFGIIFAFTTIKDISKYIFKKQLDKNNYGKLDWYFEHLTRMFISFIAAVTAFTSIQNVFRNNTLNFLVPTFVGILAIYLIKKKYKKKLIK